MMFEWDVFQIGKRARELDIEIKVAMEKLQPDDFPEIRDLIGSEISLDALGAAILLAQEEGPLFDSVRGNAKSVIETLITAGEAISGDVPDKPLFIAALRRVWAMHHTYVELAAREPLHKGLCDLIADTKGG